MSGPVGAPLLQVRSLTVRYPGRFALRDVTFTVRPGEFVALTGPNGSGKSTLLRAVLALVDPSGGTVEVGGRPTGTLSHRERARWISWVPQEELPRDNIALKEYVMFGRYAHLPPFGPERAEDRSQVLAALRAAELEDRADSGVLELSGGERQRLLLARALTQEAPLLLLDEPTAHLDIGHELDLLDRVRRLVVERGGAVVAAMHDLNLAARFADRVVVLSRGRQVDDGPPGRVLTERLLREVWGVSAELRSDPRTGHPYLVPRLPSDAARPAPTGLRGPVHVVGGGGAAAPLMRWLWEAGYRQSAGALHLLDTDAQTAEELGIVFAAEVPFAPLGPSAREELRRLLAAARVVVVAPFAVGPSNLANLEELLALPEGKPILLFGEDPGTGRDFTGGRAREIYRGLVGRGAVRVGDRSELLRRLGELLPAPE
jgi:iron complex transport system ATP-binding protein